MLHFSESFQFYSTYFWNEGTVHAKYTQQPTFRCTTALISGIMMLFIKVICNHSMISFSAELAISTSPASYFCSNDKSEHIISYVMFTSSFSLPLLHITLRLSTLNSIHRFIAPSLSIKFLPHFFIFEETIGTGERKQQP